MEGLVVAVLGAVLGTVQQVLAEHGLDIGAYDWQFILDVALTAGGSYLSKNLFTTADGKFMGVMKP